MKIKSLLSSVALLLALSVLLLSCGADKDTGNKVGELCYGYDVALCNGDGLTGQTFNPADNDGRVTVINFWGVWCPYCLDEMPYFDIIASEYEDVTVLAIHSVSSSSRMPDYIKENYSDSKILFGVDNMGVQYDEYYYMLGGTGAYPMTVILDRDGVISAVYPQAISYQTLKQAVEKIL